MTHQRTRWGSPSTRPFPWACAPSHPGSSSSLTPPFLSHACEGGPRPVCCARAAAQPSSFTPANTRTITHTHGPHHSPTSPAAHCHIRNSVRLCVRETERERQWVWKEGERERGRERHSPFSLGFKASVGSSCVVLDKPPHFPAPLSFANIKGSFWDNLLPE